MSRTAKQPFLASGSWQTASAGETIGVCIFQQLKLTHTHKNSHSAP